MHTDTSTSPGTPVRVIVNMNAPSFPMAMCLQRWAHPYWSADKRCIAKPSEQKYTRHTETYGYILWLGHS